MGSVTSAPSSSTSCQSFGAWLSSRPFTGENPASIVDANNMKQVNDLSEIESVIDKIIENNPDQVNALSEKPNLIGWFVGQVMKETQGKANPKTVNEILGKKLLKKG